jgi:dephospho-CoA kinase
MAGSARLVIGITGHIGAGKTSAGKYLASRYGFAYLRYSQVLADWKAADQGAKGSLQAVGWEVMSGPMQSELNARLIAHIGPKGDYAVDGLRHPLDYESLHKTFASSFHLLYVDCPAEARWQRLRSKPRFATFDKFQASDSHPVEQNIDSLRPMAEAVITNNGSLPELYAKVDAILQNIRPGGQP